jgi:K+-sensing histidine kinase KdpD
VLENLIGNALKFTPEGGCVRVAARLTQDPPDAAAVLISVSDTGPGIPLEIQSQLFQKFVTGGQQEHGSGLGSLRKLAIETTDSTSEDNNAQLVNITFSLRREGPKQW